MKHLLCRAIAAATLFGVAATGQAVEPEFHDVDIVALQRAYLACDRAASQRQLSFSEAAECSVVSEQLLRHGHGNDFERLLAWWRAQKDAAAAAAEPVELARR